MKPALGLALLTLACGSVEGPEEAATGKKFSLRRAALGGSRCAGRQLSACPSSVRHSVGLEIGPVAAAGDVERDAMHSPTFGGIQSAQ